MIAGTAGVFISLCHGPIQRSGAHFHVAAGCFFLCLLFFFRHALHAETAGTSGASRKRQQIGPTYVRSRRKRGGRRAEVRRLRRWQPLKVASGHSLSPPRPTRPHLHLLPPPPPLHFSSHSGCDLTTKREDVFSRQVFAPVIPSVHWSERRCVCLLVFAVSIVLPQPSALPITINHPSPAFADDVFFFFQSRSSCGSGHERLA